MSNKGKVRLNWKSRTKQPSRPVTITKVSPWASELTPEERAKRIRWGY